MLQIGPRKPEEPFDYMRLSALLRSLLGKQSKTPEAVNPQPSLADTLNRMRRDWDLRATENARYYVASTHEVWSDEEFVRSGRECVEQFITSDPAVLANKSAKAMRVLEIGCGAGRMVRPLSEVFGEVYAIDISHEMLKKARPLASGRPNVLLLQNSGDDLSMFGDGVFDFVFSWVVFQHIPSKAVISSYIQDVSRVLRPGSMFKFQIQGARIPEGHVDTWTGVGWTEEEMLELAAKCGFSVKDSTGAGTQYYCLSFIKPNVL